MGMRILPEVTPATASFWRSGADGKLRILKCADCAQFVHPPAPSCPFCMAGKLSPEVVSGRAKVITFTLNHQRWSPLDDAKVPYAIAVVELDEQKDLRLMTNIVGCAPENVRTGMTVRVTFEKADDVYLPMFEPC